MLGKQLRYASGDSDLFFRIFGQIEQFLEHLGNTFSFVLRVPSLYQYIFVVMVFAMNIKFFS